MPDQTENKKSKPTLDKQIFFYILIRSWNSFDYFERCINSVLTQKYTNYLVLFVDDCSDYSLNQKKFIRQKLSKHIVLFNTKKKYSVRNAHELLTQYAKDPEGVVVSLDGDDWLIDQNVLSYLNLQYSKHACYFTYGNCLVWDGRTTSPATTFDPLANTSYPISTRKKNSFRLEPFRPLHLRTWKVWLFKKIETTYFQDSSKKWLRFCEDMAIFFPFLEMAFKQGLVIKKPLSVYNIYTPLSDIKTNTNATLQEEITIRKMKPHAALSTL